MLVEHHPDAYPRNRILAALPAGEYERIARKLERVDLETRQVLYDVDRPIEHVYFPENAVASVLSITADGSSIETATVGREGLVGLALFLGADSTPAQAFCQIPGQALRMKAGAFRAYAARSRSLHALLHRYTQALLTLVAQSSACNRLHTMEARCARWLLHTRERVGADEFPMTHRFLSQMLGVRRATVTVAAGALQKAGLIEYTMGTIRVLDRAGLEAASCECYAIITRDFDWLLEGKERPSPLRGVTTSEHGKTAAREASPREESQIGTAD